MPVEAPRRAGPGIQRLILSRPPYYKWSMNSSHQWHRLLAPGATAQAAQQHSTGRRPQEGDLRPSKRRPACRCNATRELAGARRRPLLRLPKDSQGPWQDPRCNAPAYPPPHRASPGVFGEVVLAPESAATEQAPSVYFSPLADRSCLATSACTAQLTTL